MVLTYELVNVFGREKSVLAVASSDHRSLVLLVLAARLATDKRVGIVASANMATMLQLTHNGHDIQQCW